MSSISFVNPTSIPPSSPAEINQNLIKELLKCNKEHDLDSSIQDLPRGIYADLATAAIKQLNEAAPCTDLAREALPELKKVAKRLVEETLKNQLSKLADKVIKHTNKVIKHTNKVIKLDLSIQKLQPDTCVGLTKKALQQLKEAVTCADLAREVIEKLKKVAKRLVEETLKNQLSNLADKLIKHTHAVNRFFKHANRLIEHMSAGPGKNAYQTQLKKFKELFASNADMKQQAESYVKSSSLAETSQNLIEELLKCDEEHALDLSIQELPPGTRADLAEKVLQQLGEAAKRPVEETRKNQLSNLADKLIKHMSVGPKKNACQIQLKQLKELFASNADMKQQVEITVSSTSNAYRKACPELAQDKKLGLIEDEMALLLIKYLNDYSWQKVSNKFNISGLKINWNYLYKCILNVVETFVASQTWVQELRHSPFRTDPQSYMRNELRDYFDSHCDNLKVCIDNIIKRALTPIPQYATNDLVVFVGEMVALNIYERDESVNSVLAHEISSLIIPSSYFESNPWRKNCVLIPFEGMYIRSLDNIKKARFHMPFEPLGYIREPLLKWFSKDSPEALFYKAVGNLQTLVGKNLENPNVVSPHREGIDKHNSQTETL